MPKLTPQQKLAIYERVLVGYRANKDPKTAVQERLIAGLEADIEKMEAGHG